MFTTTISKLIETNNQQPVVFVDERALATLDQRIRQAPPYLGEVNKVYITSDVLVGLARQNNQNSRNLLKSIQDESRVNDWTVTLVLREALDISKALQISTLFDDVMREAAREAASWVYANVAQLAGRDEGRQAMLLQRATVMPILVEQLWLLAAMRRLHQSNIRSHVITDFLDAAFATTVGMLHKWDFMTASAQRIRGDRDDHFGFNPNPQWAVLNQLVEDRQTNVERLGINIFDQGVGDGAVNTEGRRQGAVVDTNVLPGRNEFFNERFETFNTQVQQVFDHDLGVLVVPHRVALEVLRHSIFGPVGNNQQGPDNWRRNARMWNRPRLRLGAGTQGQLLPHGVQLGCETTQRVEKVLEHVEILRQNRAENIEIGISDEEVVLLGYFRQQPVLSDDRDLGRWAENVFPNGVTVFYVNA